MAFLILFLCWFKEIVALQVYMNNVTTEISSNRTILTCTYILQQDEVLTIGIMAYNKSADTFEHIAGYRPQHTSQLLTYGEYLNGRVTLSNITRDSTQAFIVFHEIRCIDETLYKCSVTYLDKALKLLTVESSKVNVTVTVSPGKPSSLYMRDTSLPLIETNNATFICEGNVGKPQGKLIWRKQKYEDNVPEVNTNIQTKYTEKEDTCSYTGISSFIITLSDIDNQAVISCAEESLMNNNAMFTYSQPINVLFKVRTPSIMKYPNFPTYIEGIEIIILTCICQGNPQPAYLWYYNDTLIHTGSVLDIQNGKIQESGLYICNASNSFSGTTFVSSNSVEIQIIKKTEYIPSSPKYSRTEVTSIIGSICGILAVVIIISVIRNLYSHKCRCINKKNISTEPINQEMNVYNIIDETEYERTGKTYTHLYNEISKADKCTDKNSQLTESEQEQ